MVNWRAAGISGFGFEGGVSLFEIFYLRFVELGYFGAFAFCGFPE